MKTLHFYLAFMLIALMGISQATLATNDKTPEDVTIQTRTMPAFTGLKVGGAFNVTIIQGEPQEVKVETDADLQEKIQTEVSNGTLSISSKGIRNPKKLNIFITVPHLTMIEASGASTIKTEGILKEDVLTLEASGASNVSLTVDYQKLNSEISGAADVKLNGRAVSHSSEVSGAGSLKSYDLECDTLNIEVSGAGDARVDVKQMAYTDISGAGSLKYKTSPPNLISKGKDEVIVRSNAEGKQMVNVGGDTVEVNLGSIKVKANEHDGSSLVVVGKNRISVDDEGNVKIRRDNHKKEFEGHWGGFDLSYNGFLNKDFNMDLPSYLDLEAKSIGVHLNIYEQNIQLSGNGNFGLITGIGFEWNNYRFSGPMTMVNDLEDNTTKFYELHNISIEKTKLVTSYLTVPVLFELQSNGDRKINDIHFSAGVLLGLRLGSHTKIVYQEQNKEYEIVDPVSGSLIGTGISPKDDTDKEYGSFNMYPFKADAMVRVGWGYINLFAKYSLGTLFKTNRGPEVYPFAVGITLVNW
jgi:hypothetical protein